MKTIKYIDKISQWAGTVSAWLVIPLMFVVMYEVAMRRIFNAPTGWGYDTCWMLFAAQFMIGGGYTLLKKGHIRIDIVYGVLSERAKLVFDLFLYLIVILPVMGLFAWAGVIYAADAWSTGEKLSTTNWFFPSGPSKTLIPVGFFLLGLQCLAEIIRTVKELRKGNA